MIAVVIILLLLVLLVASAQGPSELPGGGQTNRAPSPDQLGDGGCSVGRAGGDAAGAHSPESNGRARMSARTSARHAE
jgi:hypothetical protein